jgi:hypothetical protein
MNDFVAETYTRSIANGLVHVVASPLNRQSLVQGCGQTSTWQALEIVKINNASYYHIIVIQGLKAQLNFELEYLQYCIGR